MCKDVLIWKNPRELFQIQSLRVARRRALGSESLELVLRRLWTLWRLELEADAPDTWDTWDTWDAPEALGEALGEAASGDAASGGDAAGSDGRWLETLDAPLHSSDAAGEVNHHRLLRKRET